ncbi:uncharacterized protein LOC117191334 [Drosophila miranda]|uniref:uncharacterized protein LOC117191334 n=1 Tax=Drosophila miranda TaxID=7229 RepID=UPI00143F8074|nr:uncharacterized protein LOC117191334 [Drosophila miranda]
MEKLKLRTKYLRYNRSDIYNKNIDADKEDKQQRSTGRHNKRNANIALYTGRLCCPPVPCCWLAGFLVLACSVGKKVGDGERLWFGRPSYICQVEMAHPIKWHWSGHPKMHCAVCWHWHRKVMPTVREILE